VRFGDNINAGTAAGSVTIEATANGNCHGDMTETFDIAKIPYPLQKDFYITPDIFFC